MATPNPNQKKKAAPAKAAAPKGASAAAAPRAAVSAPKQVDERNPLQKRRVVVGTVVSDKMQKTIVVKVDRRVRHGLYQKYVTKSRRFKAHDEKNEAKTGDLVSLVESRPLSRQKRWVLREIIRKGAQVTEINV